jgi:general secretion pathway protein K
MNQRGLVLMSVLWVVLVVSFVSFALAAAVRAEVASAGNSFDSERALFMARGAAEVIFLNLQKPGTLRGAPIRREGNTYVVPFDSGEARVQFASEGERIDLNVADEKVLASMFDSLGLDGQSTNELVDCILDWRDPDDVPRLYGAEVTDYGQVFLDRGQRLPRNAPFETMEELALVKHMTPEIFFGHVQFDPVTKTYHKTPGLRDIATVHSGSPTVNVNTASIDVLAALPAVGRALAETIATERQQTPFSDANDLFRRIPNLQNTPAVPYMSTQSPPPNMLVSTATIQPSGTTRTARLTFIRERQKKILTASPLIYLDVEVIKFRGWEY